MIPGKAIIIGGSLGGLFVGALLQRAGWEISIHERSGSGLSGKGAGLVPQPEVSLIVENIGRRVVMHSGVMAKERIFLDRDGRVVHTIRSPQAQISWDVLFAAFRQEIPDSRYFLGDAVTAVTSSDAHPTVSFANGRIETADLVIGADGIRSVVRTAVAPGTEPEYAGYVAFRGLAPERDLPEESAPVVSDRFIFFNSSQSQFLGYLVAGPDGSVAPGARRYNWVWYRPMTHFELGEALTSDDGERRSYSAPAAGVSKATKDRLYASAQQLLPPVLREIVIRERYPFIQAIFDYEAPRMWKPGLVLVGDAAFVVRPHTAMGVSKAAGDAMVLQEALMKAPSIASALELYEKARMSTGRAIASYGRELGHGIMNRAL